MKFTSFTVFSTLLVSASAGNFFQQAQGFRELIGGSATGAPVPGKNPLYFCDDTSHDIATIESVDMTPNPPAPGESLNITATGVLHNAIYPGAQVDLVVKYGLITLFKQKFDLCENVGQVDLKCPIDQGKLVLNKSVDIPKTIPPGTYTVIAMAFTNDDHRITCLTASIIF